MPRSLFLFLMFFFPAFYSAAQNVDSLAYHPGKWGFEILTGTAVPSKFYNEYYDRTISTAYGPALARSKSEDVTSMNSLSLLDLAILKPTFKAALNYRYSNHFSASLGCRYYYTSFSTHYSLVFPQGNYIMDQVSDMTCSVNDCELFIGSRSHLKNFFLGLSLNLNIALMRESENTTYELNTSHTAPHGHYTYYDSFFEDKGYRYNSYQPGGGLCVGYDIPLEKHFLELELSADYYEISPKFTTLENYKVGCLNIALSMGFKF